MRSGLLACAAAILLWQAPQGAAADSASRQQADVLVEAASAYVARYQEQLTSVVADETYTQHVRVQVPRDKGMPPSRVTTSEVFFLYVPGYDWMAMRDVETVNGRTLHRLERPDLQEALRRLPAPEVAREFKGYNARYNLGRVLRNFNEPTLALLVLDPKHRDRFEFSPRRSSRIDGGPIDSVGFREVQGPTLVRDLNGNPVFATGEITVERQTGRVWRTLFALAIGSVRMTLSTTYEHDVRLDMLVPVRFGESYQDGVLPNDARRALLDPTVFYEEIVCEAKYANFRRFEVKASIR